MDQQHQQQTHHRSSSAPCASHFHRQNSVRTLVASNADDATSMTRKRSRDTNSIDDTASTIVNESGYLSRSGSKRSQKRLTDWQGVTKINLFNEKYGSTDNTTLRNNNSNNSSDDDDDDIERGSDTTIQEEIEKTKDEPYSIFSKWKKRWIVLLASIAAFFAPFSVNSYFPAMNTVEKVS